MKIHNFKVKIIAIILIFVYALILYLTPLNCPFDMLFKFPCPGCGMTRAWVSVLNFNIEKAYFCHKMFWSLPLLFAGFLFDGRIFKNKKLNLLLWIFISVGFVLSWIEKLVI